MKPHRKLYDMPPHGTPAYLAIIGRIGGQATSEAKRKASIENGRKSKTGGRPRKTPK